MPSFPYLSSARRLGVLLGLLAGTACAAPPAEDGAVRTLRLGVGTPLSLEIAATPDAQRQGLMHRRMLPENTGMLFPLDPPRAVSLWMKNTLIDLDAAFVDACGEVFRIVSMRAESLRLHRSGRPAAWVIELPRGEFARRGVAQGRRIPELVTPHCPRP